MPRHSRPPLSSSAWLLMCSAFVLLSGCEQLGIETPETIAAARDADGRAIGGACRHAGRAIEDCYTLYKKAERSAVFAGWRDMNDYMRENKIEAVAPVLPQNQQEAAPVVDEQAAEDSSERSRGKKVAASAKH